MGIAYNTSIVRDGLVLHLDAANVKSYPGSGTVWKDLSGLGNNGTIANGVGYDTTNNGSLVFDGVNDYVEKAAPALNLTGDIEATLEGWFYFTGSNGTGSYTTFFAYGNGPLANDTISIGVFDNYRISISFNGGQNALTAQNTLPLNIWSHIVVTKLRGPINLSTKIYLNSAAQTIVSSPSGTPNVIGRVVRIGRWTNEGAPYYYQGEATGCKIYNRALTEAEVKQNFESMRGRYGI